MKILAIICMLAGIAWGQTPWQLTTADLLTQKVEVRKMDSGGLDYLDGEGHAHHLPLDRFVEMRRIGPGEMNSSSWMLLFADSQRWAGTAVGLKGDQLNWHSPLLGELPVHLSDVSQIIHAGSPVPSAPNGDEDVVYLANGDAVRGAIFAMSDQDVSLQSSSAPVNIAWSAIAGIDFAHLPDGHLAKKAPARWQITLDDGTILHAPAIAWAGNGLKFAVSARSCSVELSRILAIAQLQGPVLFLASRPPVENIQTPLLGAPWPARFGVNLEGQPEANAISVHAYSRLTWDVPGDFEKFHFQYAVPGQLSLADISVRVQIDGKIAYEQSHLHAGTISPAIELPLNRGRRLTLEVDTDNPYRTQGWLTWVSPALVR